MKSLKLHDTIWADGYKSKVTKITDDGIVGLVLDDGLITEFYYECLLGDISLDNDGDFALECGDEIRYYSFYDITWDIMDGYWISSINEQVFSPTVKRKLKVYEVQDSVYLYSYLDELKEIYELLGEPPIQGFYGTDSYENLTDSLQYKYGLVYYWENWDSEREYMYKYMNVIQGAYIKE